MRKVAAADDCEGLRACYLPAGGAEQVCDQAERCGQLAPTGLDRAQCIESFSPSGFPKFDHMLPLHCIATLDAAAACSDVQVCLKAGS